MALTSTRCRPSRSHPRGILRSKIVRNNTGGALGCKGVSRRKPHPRCPGSSCGKDVGDFRMLTRIEWMDDGAVVSTKALPFRSANEAWDHRVSSSGDALAYRHKAGGAWRDVSWREADAQAQEIAAGLASIGLLPGDRIGLLSQTRFEW